MTATTTAATAGVAGSGGAGARAGRFGTTFWVAAGLIAAWMSGTGEFLVRKCIVRSPTAKRSGKKGALGKIRCTIDPRFFPKASILPGKLRLSYW